MWLMRLIFLIAFMEVSAAAAFLLTQENVVLFLQQFLIYCNNLLVYYQNQT